MLSDAERSFIERHRVARLATADRDAVPHVIPIVYALVGGDIYFVIDDKPKRAGKVLKRLQNIADNPRVALIIDDYDERWENLRYLLVHGTAEAVEDGREYARALAALRRRYPQYQAMPLALGRNAMIRIRPERTHFWKAAPPSC